MKSLPNNVNDNQNNRYTMKPFPNTVNNSQNNKYTVTALAKKGDEIMNADILQILWPRFEKKTSLSGRRSLSDSLLQNVNKDLLRTSHFPAAGRQVSIFCRFLNNDLLKTDHFLAVQISCRFLDEDL